MTLTELESWRELALPVPIKVSSGKSHTLGESPSEICKHTHHDYRSPSVTHPKIIMFWSFPQISYGLITQPLKSQGPFTSLWPTRAHPCLHQNFTKTLIGTSGAESCVFFTLGGGEWIACMACRFFFPESSMQNKLHWIFHAEEIALNLPCTISCIEWCNSASKQPCCQHLPCKTKGWKDTFLKKNCNFHMPYLSPYE